MERIEFGTALVDSTDPCGSIFLPIRAVMKGGDRVGHMDDVLMDGMGWDGLKLHSMNPGGKNNEEYCWND